MDKSYEGGEDREIQYKRPAHHVFMGGKKPKIDETTNLLDECGSWINTHGDTVDETGSIDSSGYQDPIRVLLNNCYHIISIGPIDGNGRAYKVKDMERSVEYDIWISDTIDGRNSSIGIDDRENKCEFNGYSAPNTDIPVIHGASLRVYNQNRGGNSDAHLSSIFSIPMTPQTDTPQHGLDNGTVSTLSVYGKSERQTVGGDDVNDSNIDPIELNNKITAINSEIERFSLLVGKMNLEFDALHKMSEEIVRKLDELVGESEIFHNKFSEKLVPKCFSDYYMRITNYRQVQRLFSDSRHLINDLHLNFGFATKNWRQIREFSEGLLNLNLNLSVKMSTSEKILSMAEIAGQYFSEHTMTGGNVEILMCDGINKRRTLENLKIKSRYSECRNISLIDHLHHLRESDLSHPQLRDYQPIEHVDLSQVPDLLPTSTHLEKLTASKRGKPFNCLSQIMNHFTNLRTLDISDSVLDPTECGEIKYLTNIVDLTICFQNIDYELINLIHNLTKLESLSLTINRENYYGDDRIVENFKPLSKLSNLKALTISNDRCLMKTDFKDFKYVKSLDSFTLADCAVSWKENTELLAMLKKTHRINTIIFDSIESAYPDCNFHENEFPDVEYTLRNPHHVGRYRGRPLDDDGDEDDIDDQYYGPDDDIDDEDDRNY